MQISRQLLHERQFALIHHYLDRLKTLYELHTRGQASAQEALRAFDMEWRQFQAQQQWAAATALKDARAAALVASFPDTAQTLLAQVDIQLALKWLEDALVWASIEDMELRFRLLMRSYDLYRLRINLERAREMLDAAAAVAEQLDDDVRRAELARKYADYFDVLHDRPNQLAWAEHGLTLALRLEDQVQIANAYHELGFTCFKIDQYSRAEVYLLEARRIFQELGMRLKVGVVLNALAANAVFWGKFEQVAPYGDEALAIAREFGRRDTEQVVFTNLALFLSGTPYVEKGYRYGLQAMAVGVELGSVNSELRALGAVLLSSANLGLVEELDGYIERAQAALREVDYKALHGILNWVQWQTRYEQGHWAAACDYAEQMLPSAQRRNSPDDEYEGLGALGNNLAELGKLDEAAAAHQRGLAMRDETFENQQVRGNNLAGLCYVRVRQGRLEEAQQLFDQFFVLMAEHTLVRLDLRFMVAWNAYRAAQGLGDPRIEEVIAQIRTLLDTYLNEIQDERLRTSFLNQYSLRSLLTLHPLE